MLIVPVSRRPDWQNPPLITLALILINCLIFFGWQSGDDVKLERAHRFYAESTLPAIEFPLYIKHLEQGGRDEEAESAKQALSDKELPAILLPMEADEAFMKRLRAGHIVTSADENHARL